MNLKDLSLALVFLLLSSFGLALSPGQVNVTMTTDPFLVSDSNNCAVGVGPRAAYVGFRITNTSGTTLQNMQATLGGFATGFGLNGGQAATQGIGGLAPGESRTLYWHIYYPCHTASVKDSQLSLILSDSNPGTVTISNSGTMVTSTSSISASAGGQVSNTILGPGAVLGQVITYDVTYSFGNIQANDRFNMQPAGNTSYNAGCFQLVNARVTASQVNAIPVGTSNQLFFTATSSQGGSGNTVTVRYYIKYLCANTSTTASPYASQTSGGQFKYSGNFGAAATQITFPGATNSLSISKTASASTVLPGSEVVYTVTITNSSSQYDAYIERILDHLPSGVTFVGIEPGSDVTAGNSSQVPQPGATGTISFIGKPFVVDSSGNVSGSYLVPKGGSIRLIYRVTMPSVEGTYSNSVTAHIGSTSIGPASATVYVAVPKISGKVYEDIPGTAQPSGFTPRPGVRVRLYQDANNNGQIDASDPFVAQTTTASDGGYTFSLSAYGTYLVAVDSRSVSPSTGFNSGYGQGDVWAEQTYGDNPATPGLDLGPRYGGRAPGASDGFNATDTAPSANTGAKHLARVAVSGGEVTGVDFAFSFNVVTNLRGGGTEDEDTSANRTVQGSLRQFLQNANAIAGANAMRFVPASPYTPNTSGSGGSWWTLSVTNPLPFVQDASTTLDGTTYDALNPLSVRDTSPGSLGTGGTVGVDALPLPQTPRPELALNFSNQTNASGTAGIRVEAQNTTIRRLSLYGQRGFSTGGQAAIFITSTGQATLEELVVGTLPDGSDPASVGAQQNRRYGVRLEGQATVRRSYFAYNGYAILLNGPSAQGSLIEGNEFAYNGPNSTSTEGAPDGDSVAFWNSGSAWSTQTVFRGNLVRDVREVSGGTAGTDPGKGLELWYSGTRNVLIENNTILRARTAGIGIHAWARDNTIRKNLIQDTLGYAGQGGAGVHLSNTGGTPLRNRITQNHFGGNRGVAIDLDAGTWTLGDGVTPNDGNCNNTSQPNLGLDFPVITLAQVVGGGLQVQGTACPGVTVEVYKALAGSGDTLGGLGYGEGVLYLGSGTANASGAFSFTVSLAGLASGDYVSAIAIDANGNTSEFSANVQVVFGYAISGLVYHDREPNGMRSAEDWSDGAMVYVKLVQGTTVLAVQMVSAGSGAYSFSGVAPGTYTLVLDDGIHPADTTPTPPSGWLFINPAGGSRTVTVSSTNVLGQDFGLFHGFRVEGRVFYDDGESGGNANNALQDGSERGVGSVTITATSDYPVRTATTDGSGFYQLYIPASWDSVVLSHPVRPATGHNNGSLASQVASWADATSPASSGAVISLGSAGSLAGATYVHNFGVIRPSLLSPDQAGQATSPGVITYAHQFKPGTLGNATLSLAPTQFSYQLRRDVNCDDDFDDPGEGFQGLPLSFSVNASWPRESDGSLRGCALEVRVIVPAGLSAGQVDLAPFSLNLAWASNPAVVEVRSLTDTTTVIRGGELRLTKQARNHTQNTSFASSAQGRPGEVLEYRIAYQNIGSQPIFNVILFDPVPFFTTLVQNAYGTSGEVELVCPDGTVVRPDLGTTSNISLNLASLCTLSTAPLPGGGSAPALLPGQGGFFVYRVQVN